MCRQCIQIVLVCNSAEISTQVSQDEDWWSLLFSSQREEQKSNLTCMKFYVNILMPKVAAVWFQIMLQHYLWWTLSKTPTSELYCDTEQRCPINAKQCILHTGKNWDFSSHAAGGRDKWIQHLRYLYIGCSHPTQSAKSCLCKLHEFFPPASEDTA